MAKILAAVAVSGIVFSSATVASAAVSNDPNYTATLLTSGLTNPTNGVVFRPAFSDVLVSEYGLGQVTRVGASSGAKTLFAPVPSPDEMAINSAGDVYVKEHPLGPIHRFSSAGTPLSPATFSTSPCGAPTGLAFDATDNLYVACPNGTIYEFAAGTFASPTEFASGFGSLEGIGFSPGGTLFVTQHLTGEVYAVTPGGTALADHTLWASGLNCPLNVAFDPISGNLFASSTDSVVRIPLPGVVTAFASGFSPGCGRGTYDLDFDGVGCLYVGDFTAGELWKFCPKVNDPAITAKGRTFKSDEDRPFTRKVATFKDPDKRSTAAEYTATIDWGDNSAPTAGVVSGPTGGQFRVKGSHTYPEDTQDTTYTVTVTITDADNPANTTTITSTTQPAE